MPKNATDEFAAFVEQRNDERARTVKVTWRKVSDLTGGGWSGLGPNGALVYVERNARQGFTYGHRYGARKVAIGERRVFVQAKAAAEQLLESR